MIKRDNYLKRMIDAKDTEFIKVITGVRRSGKSTLLLMFKEYLLSEKVKEENIIYRKMFLHIFKKCNNTFTSS